MTAFATGTATSHTDLFGKLTTFLTSNAALVAADEEWEVAANHGTYEKVLRGPGLSAADEVLVGLKLVERPTEDEYEIQLTGMSGVLAGATTFDGHVNTAPTHVRMFVDSGAVSYWFVANGRRFVVVLKISTVFQTMYAGFFLPYAAPTEYAYPLFIGGSAGQSSTAISPSSWRSVDVGHRHFPHSYYDTSIISLHPPCALMLSPQGDWLTVAATGVDANVAIAPRRFHSGFSVNTTAGLSGYGYQSIRERLQSCFGGDLLLTPLTLVQSSPSDQCYGILDGCYHVPGFGNSSENIVTVGAVDHLTVQDAFRSEIGEYWALALE
jgi:hypothetical protein